MSAACWHISYSRIFCSWQIQNCFVSVVNKTSWCFEVMCCSYWGVCWAGGKLFCAFSWKEVLQRSPGRQWHWSGSLVLSSCDLLLLLAPVLGGSLVLVQAGISLLGSGSWLTRWCCIYLYKSKSSLADSGCCQAGQLRLLLSWYPAEITVAFVQANEMAIKTSHAILILHRLERVLSLGTCIISFSSSLIVAGPFIKYFSIC